MNIYDLSKLKDTILENRSAFYHILDYSAAYTKKDIIARDETLDMVKAVENAYVETVKLAFEDIINLGKPLELISIGVQFKPILSIEGIKLYQNAKDTYELEEVLVKCLEKNYILKDYVAIDNINGVVSTGNDDYTIEPNKKVAIVNFEKFKKSLKELGYNLRGLEFEEDEISFSSVAYGIVDSFYSLAASTLKIDKDMNFIIDEKENTK